MSADGAAVLLWTTEGGAIWIDVASGRDWPIRVPGLGRQVCRAFFVAGAETPCLVATRPFDAANPNQAAVDLVDLPRGGNELRLRTATTNWAGQVLPADERTNLAVVAQQRWEADGSSGGGFRPCLELRRHDPVAATLVDARVLQFPASMARSGLTEPRFSPGGRYVGCAVQSDDDLSPLQLVVWDAANGSLLCVAEAPRGDVGVATPDGMLEWFGFPELNLQRAVPVTVFGRDGKVVLKTTRHAWDVVFAADADGSVGVSNGPRVNLGTGPRRIDVRIHRPDGREVWLGAPAGVVAQVMVMRGTIVGVAPEGTILTWDRL